MIKLFRYLFFEHLRVHQIFSLWHNFFSDFLFNYVKYCLVLIIYWFNFSAHHFFLFQNQFFLLHETILLEFSLNLFSISDYEVPKVLDDPTIQKHWKYRFFFSPTWLYQVKTCFSFLLIKLNDPSILQNYLYYIWVHIKFTLSLLQPNHQY